MNWIRRLVNGPLALFTIIDLQPLKDGGLEWRPSLGDPEFMARGWRMVELALEYSEPGAAVHLYLDTGSGFREEEKLYLPLKSGRTTKRICYLPTSIKAIRLEPLESKDEINIAHFRFVWLTPWFAHERISRRLIILHPLYYGRPTKEALRRIKTEARTTGVRWRELALARYDETFKRRDAKIGYSNWIREVEEPRLPNDAMVVSTLDALSFKPTLSILLTAHDDDDVGLRQCIESVLHQSYPHWQLCIANESSTTTPVKPLLEEYVTRDDRIQWVDQPSNDELVAANGEYITSIDHGDLFAKHALLKIVQALRDVPEAAVLYSDEDKINAHGIRLDPHFKPDWNPDLLLAHNYISRMGVYKTELIHSVGGFRQGLEGNREYDLLLRCMGRLKDDQIVHIPEILYHRRATQPLDKKSTDTAAGVKLLANYFEHADPDVAVEPGLIPNTYRTHWPIPDEKPLVSILIPTRDGYKILKRCVDSILDKTTYENFEILVLNNQSRCADTLQYLETITADKRVTVHHWDYPFNYSAINNFGATKAKGALLGLLNNDIEVINPGWLEEMVSHACRKDIGCVGAKLYYQDGTVQHGGIILGIGGVASHAHKYFSRNDSGYFSRLALVQNLSAVTAACLLVRKAVFEQVGGFDEDHLAVAFNDVDFCLKVREAGFRNLWTPYAELYHEESHSRKLNDDDKKRVRERREADYMRKRWGHILIADPAYNPNLTLIYEDFSLR